MPGTGWVSKRLVINRLTHLILEQEKNLRIEVEGTEH